MILVENEIVIAVFDTYEQKSNGKLINGVIYPTGNVVEVEAPENVLPQKYCYNPTDGFYLNPSYVEYKTPEQEIAELRLEIAQSNVELFEMMLMMTGGIA